MKALFAFIQNVEADEVEASKNYREYIWWTSIDFCLLLIGCCLSSALLRNITNHGCAMKLLASFDTLNLRKKQDEDSLRAGRSF